MIDAGARSLFEPLHNGYMVLVCGSTSLIAFTISPTYYPLIGTVLAWAFTVAVALAIALSPVIVRGGPWLALAALLVPSDPEVFGLPLYTFWWAGLLVLLAALWRPGAPGTGWRVAFVVVGALSSPVILLALPLFVYRVFAVRERGELVAGGVAIGCAALQIGALLRLAHRRGLRPTTSSTSAGPRTSWRARPCAADT